MKRSKKVALMLMVPATTLFMMGCSEESEQAVVFSSAEECAQSGLSSWDQCDADFKNAQALHPQVAPKYLDKAECENDFGAGKCEPAPRSPEYSSSTFMPMMMGFMAGQMLNRSGGGGAQYAGSNFNRQQPASAPSNGGGGSGGFGGSTGRGFNSSHFTPQPLYKSRDDQQSFRTADNTAVAGRSGLASVRTADSKPHTGTFVRRGGFGSQAAMRGSYGG